VLVAVAIIVIASAARSASGADRSVAAAEELATAFRSCDEAMTATDTLRQVALENEYKAARARAVHIDRRVVRASRVKDYAVHDMLQRCDVDLPRSLADAKRKQAESDAAVALGMCRGALDAGSIEVAEQKYKRFRELSARALAFDPPIAARHVGSGDRPFREEAGRCETKIVAWLKDRREIEATALARYRDDQSKSRSR
jgi:hypothetical protein